MARRPGKQKLCPAGYCWYIFARFGLEHGPRRRAPAPARREGFAWTTRARRMAAATAMGPRVGGPAGAVERRTACVATAQRRDHDRGPLRRAPARDLCGARSRHQQLPPVDRAADRRRLSRRRCIFPHHPPRRGAGRQPPHQRGGDRARGRGAAGLPRQDARARGCARAAHCDRGLPRRRERAKRSAPASPRKRASNWRSSIRRPRRGWRRPAAPSCSIRRRRASSCSISAAARRNWCGSAGAAPAAAGRRCRTSSAGRRCRSASSRWRSATAAT